MYSNSLLLLISSGVENHHHPDKRIRSHSSVMQPYSRASFDSAILRRQIPNQAIFGCVAAYGSNRLKIQLVIAPADCSARLKVALAHITYYLMR